jgi:hypothetical protein
MPGRVDRGQHHADHQCAGQHAQRGDDRAEPALPLPVQVSADRRDRQRQVLFHQQQRQCPQHGRGPPAQHQVLQGEREQRHGEADLVEVEADRAEQAPAGPIAEPEHHARPRAQGASRDPRHRDRRHREQCGLGDQQRLRAREQRVERREQGQHGVEVVAEQRVTGPLQVGRRPSSLRIGPHRLLEDPQVVPGGLERVVPRERVTAVAGEQEAGEQIRQPRARGRVGRPGPPPRQSDHARSVAALR